VASAWFGRELETISRALLIQHDDIRAHVQDAEQLLERQEYGAAAERLAIAFELARWEFRAQLSREGSTDLLLFRRPTLRARFLRSAGVATTTTASAGATAALSA
jgi:hypothetical protein